MASSVSHRPTKVNPSFIRPFLFPGYVSRCEWRLLVAGKYSKKLMASSQAVSIRIRYHTSSTVSGQEASNVLYRGALDLPNPLFDGICVFTRPRKDIRKDDTKTIAGSSQLDRNGTKNFDVHGILQANVSNERSANLLPDVFPLPHRIMPHSTSGAAASVCAGAFKAASQYVGT